MRQKLLAVFVLLTLSALLALSWTTTVLAQADGDGDGLDGDEFGLPIVIGLAVLGYVGWQAFRRWSRKSS